jgi:hypothetical protein
MPGCAESGFEFVDGKLYTFEPTTGAERQLQRYGDYSHFLRWRPVTEVRAMLWFFFLTSLEIVAERMGPLFTLILLALSIFVPAVMFVRLGSERRRRLIAFVFATAGPVASDRAMGKCTALSRFVVRFIGA